MEKNYQFFLDVLIALLIVAAIILADNFFISLRSQPADFDWNEKSYYYQGDDLVGMVESTRNILTGESVFLPILNFHHIGTAPIKADAVTRSFYVEPENFEQIIKELIDRGYLSVFVSEVVDYLQQKQLPKQKIMAITFDDGNADFYDNAWPILSKYNIKSSMYLMTGVKGKDWLTTDQILELNDTGLVEFGSHTIWHPKMTKISGDEMDKELIGSKEYLEKLLGKKVEILAYPFGLYNEEIIDRTKSAGYKAALTFDQDVWQDPEDLFVLTRLSVYPGMNIIKFLDKLSSQK